jgi:hypothetical protein
MKIFILGFINMILLSCISSLPNELTNRGKEISEYFQSYGVATFIATDENLKKEIELFNIDGTIYTTINLLSDSVNNSNNNFDRHKKLDTLDFSPLEYYPDYYILKFEISNIVNDSIWVFVDNAKSEKKLLSNSNNLFSVESWEGY